LTDDGDYQADSGMKARNGILSQALVVLGPEMQIFSPAQSDCVEHCRDIRRDYAIERLAADRARSRHGADEAA